MNALVASVLSGLLTGLLTAAVSVRLAFGKFRRERTWERKVQSYSDIFDALFHVKHYTKIQLTRIEEGGTYDDAYMKELGARASAGYNALRKAAVIGTFVLSGEAAAELKKLDDTFDDPQYGQDIHEELEAHLDAVTRAIEALRPIAKRDLES